MSLTAIAALAALILWVILIFVLPLGPPGTAAHLSLGLSAVLFVRWWALRDSTNRA